MTTRPTTASEALAEALHRVGVCHDEHAPRATAHGLSWPKKMLAALRDAGWVLVLTDHGQPDNYWYTFSDVEHARRVERERIRRALEAEWLYTSESRIDWLERKNILAIVDDDNA